MIDMYLSSIGLLDTNAIINSLLVMSMATIALAWPVVWAMQVWDHASNTVATRYWAHVESQLLDCLTVPVHMAHWPTWNEEQIMLNELYEEAAALAVWNQLLDAPDPRNFVAADTMYNAMLATDDTIIDFGAEQTEETAEEAELDELWHRVFGDNRPVYTMRHYMDSQVALA